MSFKFNWKLNILKFTHGYVFWGSKEEIYQSWEERYIQAVNWWNIGEHAVRHSCNDNTFPAKNISKQNIANLVKRIVELPWGICMTPTVRPATTSLRMSSLMRYSRRILMKGKIVKRHFESEHRAMCCWNLKSKEALLALWI